MSWGKGRTRSIAKLITFSPEEWERVERLHRQLTASSVRYKSFGNYARKMLSEREINVTVVRPLTDPQPIAKAIGRVGVNVNQIAHWANENERITPEQVAELRDGFARIERLLGELFEERRSHEAR
jgi:hypothetical protein